MGTSHSRAEAVIRASCQQREKTSHKLEINREPGCNSCTTLYSLNSIGKKKGIILLGDRKYSSISMIYILEWLSTCILQLMILRPFHQGAFYRLLGMAP